MNLNVVIPMAGTGSRFADAGYQLPKPLVEVGKQKPMIRVVIENLGLRGSYHFLCHGNHLDEQPLASMLGLVCEGRGFGTPNVVRVDETTQGQADSVRVVLESGPLAGTLDRPVVVANCDQFLDAWHPGTFIEFVDRIDCDGAILTFNGSDPKWSFAHVADETTTVLATAEKTAIQGTKRATCGVYYFKSGRILLDAIREMMTMESSRVNGEFYLCPVYNFLIRDGHHIVEYPVVGMYGLGTPEDLKDFQANLGAGRVRI